MQNIYLPIDNISAYRCYVLLNSSTIRVYEDSFQLGDNNYTDYFIKSHYIYKTGKETFSTVQDYPTCLDIQNFTNKQEYRFDYFEILGLTVLLFIITLIFPYMVFRRLFGRWLKV